MIGFAVYPARSIKAMESQDDGHKRFQRHETNKEPYILQKKKWAQKDELIW